MNHDAFRLDLVGPADVAGPVHGQGSARRADRRFGARRAIATVAVVAVPVGLATGVAFALTSRAPVAAPVPVDTPSLVAPSPTTDHAPVPPPSVLPELRLGTRYHLGLTGRAATVYAVRAGTADADVVVSVPLADNPCVANSITVSPDARRLAWVRGGDATGMGTLVTADVDGSNQRTLATGVNCLGSTALVWQGGDRLLVRQRMGAFLLLDVAAGRPVDRDPGPERDHCWSPDGRWLAAVSAGGPHVTGPDGNRTYHYTPPWAEAQRYNGWAARSVSMDGRYVAVGWKDTQPARMDGSFAVVDLPVEGEVTSIHFTADRRILVRTPDRITVLDSRLQAIGQATEPASVRPLTLLAYAPD
ncbi:hypothetical protein QTQ03_19505 [Micromonospora sp. WMMA1363]|uniref:hypothetical protein n=1 Tax=Micromonospora sp. WMMA1363 TaxID=3053985 RepID=UPI00259C7843|nr:hypothetical protein [Micromonospora sp. WMMA1363]MDM4721671.1 hypothetical protein [Micromonospora sp. WMMA1363]